jgi:hypothetical protein
MFIAFHACFSKPTYEICLQSLGLEDYINIQLVLQSYQLKNPQKGTQKERLIALDLLFSFFEVNESP